MLDPADCGPAFLGLPQDVQGWTYDYPAVFFAKKVHRIRRVTPDADEVADAARFAEITDRSERQKQDRYLGRKRKTMKERAS